MKEYRISNACRSIRRIEHLPLPLNPPPPPPTSNINKTNRSDGKIELLTKGDNNRVGDRGLYAPGQLWLDREDILGRAAGTLRYLGMVTIILNDYPMLKCVPLCVCEEAKWDGGV